MNENDHKIALCLEVDSWSLPTVVYITNTSGNRLFSTYTDYTHMLCKPSTCPPRYPSLDNTSMLNGQAPIHLHLHI
jgi:hypothetical protein